MTHGQKAQPAYVTFVSGTEAKKLGHEFESEYKTLYLSKLEIEKTPNLHICPNFLKLLEEIYSWFKDYQI